MLKPIVRKKQQHEFKPILKRNDKHMLVYEQSLKPNRDWNFKAEKHDERYRHRQLSTKRHQEAGASKDDEWYRHRLLSTKFIRETEASKHGECYSHGQLSTKLQQEAEASKHDERHSHRQLAIKLHHDAKASKPSEANPYLPKPQPDLFTEFEDIYDNNFIALRSDANNK